MSITQPDQQASTERSFVAAMAAPPLTFTDALHRLEACQIQLEESRTDYLSAKDFGSSSSLFTAAVVLAEAVCLTEEARVAFQHVCNEEHRQSVLEDSLGDVVA